MEDRTAPDTTIPKSTSSRNTSKGRGHGLKSRKNPRTSKRCVETFETMNNAWNAFYGSSQGIRSTSLIMKNLHETNKHTRSLQGSSPCFSHRDV